MNIREFSPEEKSAYQKEAYCSEFNKLEKINIQWIVDKRQLKNLGMHGHNCNHTQKTDIRNLMIVRLLLFFTYLCIITHSHLSLKL